MTWKNPSGEQNKEHILVVSQYFYPEDFRINDICREWVKRGDEVTVVTGIPNYPTGNFFKGYGWFKKRTEKYEGINIIRLPIIARGHNAVMMVLNYISFVISGFFWKVFSSQKSDKVFIFEVSPMTQALVGVWYAKKHKIPCYLYVQDLWPENVEIVAGIHNGFIIGLIDDMVDYIYRNCDKILATSPSFVSRIEMRKSACGKVTFLPQYAEEFYKPVDKLKAREIISEEEVFDDQTFKIIFTGNVGFAQGLDVLPRVAKMLKSDGVKCVFYIIGDGRYKNALEKKIIENNVTEMFRLLGRKRPEEVPLYMALMDVAFLSFSDNDLFKMTIPAKLQSYMACGMPIVAIAGGETKRIIEESECGVVCSHGQDMELVMVIENMANNVYDLTRMGKMAENYNRKNFDKRKIMQKLDKIINE